MRYCGIAVVAGECKRNIRHFGSSDAMWYCGIAVVAVARECNICRCCSSVDVAALRHCCGCNSLISNTIFDFCSMLLQ
jgi:hypothetical protein